MSKNKNNGMKMVKIICFIGALIILLELTIMGTYYIFHPTHYKYNDIWVKGKTIEEIEERYDEFDMVSGDGVCAGYRVCIYPESIYIDFIYYTVFFDDLGKAEKCGIYELTDLGRMIEIRP